MSGRAPGEATAPEDDDLAPDAADRLILDTADSLDRLSGPDPGATGLAAADPVAVLGSAALAGAVAERGIPVVAHADSLIDERVLSAITGCRTAPLSEVVTGARTVLLRLPRSLDELDETAAEIARGAADVVVVAGGRLKHMTPAMTEVLRRHFGRVDVTHARQKSRVLIARDPIPIGVSAGPHREHHADLDVTVVAHGGVFAGTRIDVGTRLLLSVLPAALPDARDAIDLACGSGVVAAVLARARPGIHVIATDVSALAVASARATMAANDLTDRVEVVRGVGLELQPADSADLVLLNPPFHRGAAVDASLAARLFADAARVLRPGGELWTVFNSHLRYRLDLERIVGATRQIARDPRFTVLASARPVGKSSDDA